MQAHSWKAFPHLQGHFPSHIPQIPAQAAQMDVKSAPLHHPALDVSQNRGEDLSAVTQHRFPGYSQYIPAPSHAGKPPALTDVGKGRYSRTKPSSEYIKEQKLNTKPFQTHSCALRNVPGLKNAVEKDQRTGTAKWEQLEEV